MRSSGHACSRFEARMPSSRSAPTSIRSCGLSRGLSTSYTRSRWASAAGAPSLPLSPALFRPRPAAGCITARSRQCGWRSSSTRASRWMARRWGSSRICGRTRRKWRPRRSRRRGLLFASSMAPTICPTAHRSIAASPRWHRRHTKRSGQPLSCVRRRPCAVSWMRARRGCMN